MDPFGSNLHFELPDSDNCLCSERERRSREWKEQKGERGRQGEIVGGDWDCV